MNRIQKFLVANSILFASTAHSGMMTLDDFLIQVNRDNRNITSATQSIEGAELRKNEGNDSFYPSVFANGTWSDDKRATTNPAFQGTETRYNTYSFGISENTPYGTRAKLSYNINYTNIIGANSLYLPTSTFHDESPKIEIAQSLWANAFGAASRAQRDLAEASNLANYYQSSFRAKTERLSAEIAYWRLVTARKTLTVKEANLKRAQAILDWSTRRVKLQLTDQSDLLQAQAALKIRQIELLAAKEEVANASRSLNLARGVNADLVSETLEDLQTERLQRLSLPEKAATREDVHAAEQQAIIAQASTTIEKERTAPSLEFMGTYSLNGRASGLGDSFSNSWHSDHPVWTLGLQFSMPLDFGLRSQIRQGRLLEQEAAESNWGRKQFEENQNWHILVEQFKQVQQRLSLAVELDNAQRQKLHFEQARLEKGRTTTYQVLMFEQDYSQSQLTLIQTQSELIQLHAQLKLYTKNEPTSQEQNQ